MRKAVAVYWGAFRVGVIELAADLNRKWVEYMDKIGRYPSLRQRPDIDELF